MNKPKVLSPTSLSWSKFSAATWHAYPFASLGDVGSRRLPFIAIKVFKYINVFLPFDKLTSTCVCRIVSFSVCYLQVDGVTTGYKNYMRAAAQAACGMQ